MAGPTTGSTATTSSTAPVKPLMGTIVGTDIYVGGKPKADWSGLEGSLEVTPGKLRPSGYYGTRAYESQIAALDRK